MSSPISICNRALSEIGTRSTISSFDEGSAEATQCFLWYDDVRKMLLRSAPWGFARRTADLSVLGTLAAGTSQYPWQYKYTHPADCLKFRYILQNPQLSSVDVIPPQTLFGWDTPCRDNRFLIANDRDGLGLQRRVVLSNVVDGIGVYTCDVETVGMFDPLFTQALVSIIAAKIVIALTGNAGMRSGFLASAQDAVTSARVADGNEAMPSTDHTPDWIQTRGAEPYSYLGGLPGAWYSGYDSIDWGM